jgi:hypothetical protein
MCRALFKALSPLKGSATTPPPVEVQRNACGFRDNRRPMLERIESRAPLPHRWPRDWGIRALEFGKWTRATAVKCPYAPPKGPIETT